MKQQVQQPAPVSRTLQGKAKASSQASVSDVLQAYKKDISQRQEIEDDDELLQGKFDTTQRDELEDDELLQGKFETAQREELDEDELLQGKFETAQRAELEYDELLQGKFETTQRKEAPNNTGLPDNLKAGVEQLSGLDMSDVKVHYNSSKPASVQAYAYTQGTDIHVAPGQEKHLGHEAWHVAQQKQGRVQPTTTVGGMDVNDNVRLENEADVMGGKALQMKPKENKSWVVANTVAQKKSNGKQGFGFVDNRKNKITQLMSALFNKSIDINTNDTDEKNHSYAVSIGKTPPTPDNKYGHSAIVIEGYDNSKNIHWLKFGEFYPRDAEGTSNYQKIIGVDGAINAQNDNQAAKEMKDKYVDIDVHEVKGGKTIEKVKESLGDPGEKVGPQYKLVTFNCSHWVKQIAGKMGISVGSYWPIFSTPDSLLRDDKRSRRDGKFDENKLDETYVI